MPMEMERMIFAYSFRYYHIDWPLAGVVDLNQHGPRPFRGPSLYFRPLCWMCVVYRKRSTGLHFLQADSLYYDNPIS